MYITYEKIFTEVKKIISKNFNVDLKSIGDDDYLSKFFSEPLFFIELVDEFQKIQGMPSIKDSEWRDFKNPTVRQIVGFIQCKINNNDETI